MSPSKIKLFWVVSLTLGAFLALLTIILAITNNDRQSPYGDASLAFILGGYVVLVGVLVIAYQFIKVIRGLFSSKTSTNDRNLVRKRLLIVGGLLAAWFIVGLVFQGVKALLK